MSSYLPVTTDWAEAAVLILPPLEETLVILSESIIIVAPTKEKEEKEKEMERIQKGELENLR